MAVFGKRARGHLRAVVGIDDVACATTARAIITCVIVGPEEIQSRIQKPRFLKADHHRIGSIIGSKPSISQPFPRTAWFLGSFWNTDFSSETPPAFEDPQDVGWLGNLKAG